KSPLEIQQNRELWDMAKRAMEAFVEALEPGRTERELSAEALKVVQAGGGRDTLIFVNGQVPEDRPIRMEDILSYHMEICGESGHWCELTVTLAYRDPTPGELKLMESELRAYEEIRKMARPGKATLGDLIRKFEEVLREDGWEISDEPHQHYDFHGHSMDVIEWPRWSQVDTRYDAVLEEGMQFSYHPKRKVLPYTTPTGINEDIIITANGAERLSGDWDLRWRIV